MKIVAQNANRSMIMAHNHIQGDCRPSAKDDELTKQCEVLCSINNVRLLDHFIYAKDGFFSYYKSGRMANIALNYHIQQVLGRNGNDGN